MSDERSEGLQGGEGDAGPDNLLDSFDRVIGSLPPGDPIRRDLLELRPQINDQQETMVEARRMIEKLEEVIKKACEIEKGDARPGERSVRHRWRSRVRNGWPDNKSHRNTGRRSIARRLGARIAIHGAPTFCRSSALYFEIR